jgi:hypothetical protein
MVRFRFVDSHKVVAYKSTFSTLVNILNKIVLKMRIKLLIMED